MAAREVVASRISPEHAGDSIVTDVVVASFPQRRGGTVSFIAEVRDSPWVPRRIRVGWPEPEHDIRPGETWRLELRLKRPRGTRNPGTFDYEAWLFRNGIAATGFVVGGGRNVRLSAASPGIVDSFRQRSVRRLQVTVADADRAAVLAAVSVGARHLVTPQQWERYARTGTSHLMAISGLHVGMVAGLAYLVAAAVTGLCRFSLHQHRIATAAALAAAAAYAVVSGLAVPAQRATLMIGLASLAMILGRQGSVVRSMAVAAALIACADPLSTMSPGFKLSFLAVLILVWLARQFDRVRDRTLLQRCLRAPARLLRIQLSLLFGLLPFTVLLFGRVAVTAPIVNLLAVPVFGAVTVPFGLLGLVCDGPLQPAGDVMLGIASRSLDLVETLIDVALRLPVGADNLPAMQGWRAVLLFLPAAWAVCPAGWPGRGAAILASLAVVLSAPGRPQPGCAEMTVLDVGQGTAVVILTNSAALLYDTGPSYFSGGSAAESAVLPYLAHRGIRFIDHLVVSHADLDHAGGLSAILDELDVGRIHAGDLAGPSPAARPCVAGTRWVHDGIRFEFLHPADAAAWQGNDASCVLAVAAGAHGILLSGDIEQAAESELLAAGALSPSDIVVVPHHGSRTSSSRPFVEALRPEFAIVSAGHGNRWGQPAAAVVERWLASGARLLSTAESGAVITTVCAQGGVVDIDEYRRSHRRPWHE